MKLRYLILILVPVVAAVFIVKYPRKPKSISDQVSYTIGAKFGLSLKAQGLDLEASQVGRGIDDGLNADKLQLSEGEMEAAMKTVGDKQEQDIGAQAAKNKVVAESFFEKNKTADGVKITASGLQYKILEEGQGDKPKAADAVVIKFNTYVADDTKPEPKFNPTTQAEVAVNGVIPGWSEGLQLMKKGAKAIFYVPPALGYGDRPRQGIPANAVQVFQVEMLEIKKAKPAAGKSAHH